MVLVVQWLTLLKCVCDSASISWQQSLQMPYTCVMKWLCLMKNLLIYSLNAEGFWAFNYCTVQVSFVQLELARSVWTVFNKTYHLQHCNGKHRYFLCLLCFCCWRVIKAGSRMHFLNITLLTYTPFWVFRITSGILVLPEHLTNLFSRNSVWLVQ